jgi:hypothetical protein
MLFERWFTRRADGRCEIPADLAQLERDLDARLAMRKAARSISNPYERGHVVRQINRGAKA